MAELDVSRLMSVEQAISILDTVPVTPRPVRMQIEQVEGLYLAEDQRNDRDAPPFDKSLMDGYAVISADLEKVPRELSLVETIAAGGSPASTLQRGQAIAIMTGAPIPAGADAVVPVEQTEKLGNDRVLIRTPVAPGKFIAPRGSDAPAHSVVLKAGMRLRAPQLAVAAAIGAMSLVVHAPPTISVLSTGDELVEPGQTPKGSQIRSSNDIMLLALLRQYPCTTTQFGLVPDDPALIEEKIKIALSHDLLLITGGMSMGQRDYVPAILRKLGADLKITKLRIKPGKPFVFATMPNGKFVFGLPGNPVSAYVCTRCLVSRLLLRIAGGPPAEPTQAAPLSHPLPPNGPRTFYHPAIFDGRNITPLEWKGSADIYTLAHANALLIRPENHPPQPAGEIISFLPI
jgi:molybdopterin molybdotransferase